MHFVVACFILGLICGTPYSASANGNYLPFTKEPIPKQTEQSINIDTSQGKNIKTIPLVLIIGTSEKVTLLNTGNSVQAILKSSFTSTFAFGGVLYPNIYVYSRQKYYFSNETGGVAGTTVDGKDGTQLEGCIYFYNIKYGSFENALNHRDGLFEIISRIIVREGDPNPVFNSFAPYLKQITEAGSSVEMPIVPTFLFYNLFPVDVQYYAFPGAFTNETTGEQFSSTTTIVKPVLRNRYISTQQFEDTFGSLKNLKGEPLSTEVPQKPLNNRPVVSTKGIVEIPAFVGVYPAKPGEI